MQNTPKRRNVSRTSSNVKSKNSKSKLNKNDENVNVSDNKGSNFGIKNIMKGYLKFYREKLMRKHIIIYIICLVVFFVMIATLISKINSTPDIAELAQKAKEVSESSKNIFSLIFMKKIPLIFMIILAGIAPYFFIPVIGIAYSYSLACDIVTNFNVLTGKASVIPMCIGAILQLIAVGLSVATGIQYCLLSTKRWRYSRNQDYSMIDFKRTFYEATGNKKKLKEIIKKKEEKAAKNEKNNVTVPYGYLVISFLISTVIIAIGTIISRV